MRPALLIALAAGCTPSLDPDLPIQQAVDDLLGRWTSEDKGGIAVLVDRDGETLVSAHLGLADRDRDLPLTPETPSYLASLSKPVTATVVLSLADEGHIDLDAPISEHLSDLPGWLGAPTARELLLHEAGVPDWIGLAGGHTQCLDEIAGTTNDDVLDLLRGAGEPDFAPGTDAAYSNGGYVLLALLAEAASGSTMPELVQERVAAPLGLADTWIEAGHRDGRALGTKRNGKPCDYALWTTGAGGVVASAADVVQFGRAWTEGLYQEALEPVGRPLSEDATGHGLGWFVGERVQGPVAWHTGHYAGFANVVLVAPEAGITVVALSNGSTREVAGLAEEILAHPDLR